MPFNAMFSFVLVGAAGLVTGVVGLLSPKGQRMDALLALVMGAGVGLAATAFEAWTRGPNASEQSMADVMLIASLFGFAAVVAGLILLRLRARAAEGAGDPTRAPGRPDPS